MDIIEVLSQAVKMNASDIFIVAGLPITFKIRGTIKNLTEETLSPNDTNKLITDIYEKADNRNLQNIINEGDDDFSFALKGISRFRVSTYRQRGSLAAVIRVISFALPDPTLLGIPQSVIDLAEKNKGLVLITGPAGSGKSTTLACMINHINKNKSAHIITLEDPIEYLHSHIKSIVSQREISTDTNSFVKALRASLRQSPDVILLGEMRDHETINIAMTAAETGHLVLSSLHTVGAANTIDRIVDAFPPSQQHQICIQLGMVLQAVVSQQLVPTIDGNMVAVFEIMTINTAIRNMIRESKIHQIDGVIASSASENMISMDTSLLNLYKDNIITKKTALSYASNPDILQRKIDLL